MASSGPESGLRENRRRRLPQLVPKEAAGGSSDDTPRMGSTEGSARERRRSQQRAQRQRVSESREALSPTDRTDPTLPPRSDDNEARSNKRHRKARRRVQSASMLEPETSILQGLEDEIITEKPGKKGVSLLPDIISSNYTGAAASESIPKTNIYYEQRKGFSKVNREVLNNAEKSPSRLSPFASGVPDQYAMQQQTAEILKRYTVQVAKQTHTAIQRFFVFIHGINAGYALWICIFAYVFSVPLGRQFFEIYRSIALVMQVIFYLFLAMCIVDTLDRMDPVKCNRNACNTPANTVTVVFGFLLYFAAMILNLTMMESEDAFRMTLYNTNLTSPQNNDTLTGVVNVYASSWRTLTIARAILILIAWLFISANVKFDRLSSMIKNTEENAFFQDLNLDQNQLPLENRKNLP